MPYPYTPFAMRAGQIIERALKLCNDWKGSGGDGITWTVLEVLAASNQVVLDLAEETGILRGIGLLQLVEGSRVYTLPDLCLRPLMIESDIDGSILLPSALQDFDVTVCPSGSGSPTRAFRDMLSHNQIGVIPTPDSTGESVSQGGPGILFNEAVITEETGSFILLSSGDRLLAADGSKMTLASSSGTTTVITGYERGVTRRIEGEVPQSVVGDGNTVRDIVASPHGNLTITFLRAPFRMGDDSSWPDPGIPEWFHMWIPYGVAEHIGRYSRKPINRTKLPYFSFVWQNAKNMLVSNIERPLVYQSHVTPL